MNEIFAFLLAFIISFWGSLQLGPVNVCVIQTALAQGRHQALMVATGGALPELFYSALAVWGATIINQYPVILNGFGWLVIVLLFGLGIYYFFKANKPAVINPSSGAGFIKGFLLAFFNPQLFPFWLGVLVYMEGFIDFQKGTLFSPYIAFVAGTALGAWGLLFTFVKLTLAYRQKLNNLIKHNLNRMVGGLFILLSLVELMRKLFV